MRIPRILLCLMLLHCVVATAMTSFTVSDKKHSDVSHEKFYTIQASYPEIKSANKINQLIADYLQKTITEFKDKAAANYKAIAPSPDLPKLTENSNTLTVTYKLFVNTENLISLRFAMDTYFYAMAHPNVNFYSLNYDTKTNKVLKLQDIFKSNSSYLKLLARYSKENLTAKLAKEGGNNPVEPYESGIRPEAENYAIWNLTPNGLLITFPAYQVAAYVFGPQEVVIPYANLVNELNPKYNLTMVRQQDGN